MLDHPDQQPSSAKRPFTEKQGQYLAFIDTYTVLNGRPPAEADFQQFFGVSPPTVHQMLIKLHARGLVARIPRQPRTIKILIPRSDLPQLQPIKTTVVRY